MSYRGLAALWILLNAGIWGCGEGTEFLRNGTGPLAINVLQRTPLGAGERGTFSEGLTEAAPSPLADGVEVYFAASYGTEGEAGQARGRLTARNDGLYFVQEANPTGQLMLAPGQIFSKGDDSLWEFGSYMQLLTDVARDSLAKGSGRYAMYDQVELSRVSFDGGTAQRHVRYDDAVEVSLQATSAAGVTTNTLIYFLEGRGPVAMEFRENGAVGGTFKMYVGSGG